MDFSLSDEQEMIVRSTREFVVNELYPHESEVEASGALREDLHQELKAKAILEPTSDNIIAYVRYQREQLDRASTFADVWERAIWQHPDLDYTLQRPVSTLGCACGCACGPPHK